MAQIDKFKANFDVGAKTNQFSVNLHCPKLGIKLEGWRVETATLPGRQLTSETHSTYGPLENKVYNVDQDSQQMTTEFRCDSTFYDRFIIEAWQTQIFTAQGQNVAGSAIHPIFMYPDEYMGEMNIFQYRRDDKFAMHYRLYDVFPLSYAPMNLSMTDDSILKFSVTWSFRTFSTEYAQTPELSALNKGRRYLDIALDGLKVASRFNKKAGSMLNRLESFDTALARGSNIARGLGLGD